MWLDARTLSAGETVDADVCVVGAGPAGISLALSLARTGGVRVLLVESGGIEADPQAQSLAEGVTTGDPFQPLVQTRARRFGGTAHFWNSGVGGQEVGFRCGSLHEVDFERRDWLPHSGWPFGRAELAPYMDAAHAVCRLGPSCSFDGAAWSRGQDDRPLPLDPAVLTTSVWQFGVQQTFTEHYREEIGRHPTITTMLHANVVEIETNDAASEVTRLRVARFGAEGVFVRARAYVLAAGGIESARLLLLSDRVQRTGLGNGHDVVGRYFMEHQFLHGGTLVPASRDLFNRTALYDNRVVDGALVAGKIDLTDEVIRRERLLNVSMAIFPRHPYHGRAHQEVADSLAFLLRQARRGRVPADAGRHLRTVAGGLDYAAIVALRGLSGGRLFPYHRVGPDIIEGTGWAHLDRKERRFTTYQAILHTEQAPDPDNRVTLGPEKDALGYRRARLHWRWTERDMDGVQRAQSIFARELARAGVGTYQPATDARGRPVLLHPGLHHHMGTTRMHDDPTQGVVNADSRVHGVGNLYVTGCSVFPTGGYINSTLTVVALALRLADHLRATLH